MWITWIAPANGIVTFRTAGSSFDTLLAAYTAEDLSTLQAVSSDDDGGGFFTSLVSFNATAATPYQIAVDGLGGAAGNIVLSWDLQVTAERIPVIVLQPESQTVLTGSNVTFTVAAQPLNDLRYQWFFENSLLTNATNASLTISNVQANTVGGYKMEVRNNTHSAVSETAFLEIGVEAAVVSEDKFQDLFLNEAGQPSVQRFFGAQKSAFASVAAGTIGTQVMDNSGATTEQGEPNHGGVIGGASRWFGLRAQVDGVMLIDTIGSSIDTVLAVYQGNNLLNLTLLASDNNSAPDGIRSLLKFSAKKGVNYSVAIDGARGAQGKIKLNWKLTAGLTPFAFETRGFITNAFTFQLKGPPNRSIIVESSTNLIDWTALLTNNVGSGSITLRDINSRPDKNFYRAVLVP